MFYIQLTSNATEFNQLYLQTIAELGDGLANKALRKALSKIAANIRTEASRWPAASSRLRQVVKPTIGYRVELHRTTLNNQTIRTPKVAKVGFGVGKHKKHKTPRTRPGVGVAKQNIHWFVLGTEDRFTQAGKFRGRIQPAFSGIIEKTTPLVIPKYRQAVVEVLNQQVRQLAASTKRSRARTRR